MHMSPSLVVEIGGAKDGDQRPNVHTTSISGRTLLGDDEDYELRGVYEWRMLGSNGRNPTCQAIKQCSHQQGCWSLPQKQYIKFMREALRRTSVTHKARLF